MGGMDIEILLPSIICNHLLYIFREFVRYTAHYKHYEESGVQENEDLQVSLFGKKNISFEEYFTFLIFYEYKFEIVRNDVKSQTYQKWWPPQWKPFLVLSPTKLF